MLRFVPAVAVAVLAVVATVLALAVGAGWWWAAVPLLALTALAGWDLVQTRHVVLRTYPLTGHLRWVAEDLRPEIQQYFVESDTDGRPFDRDTRSIVYERAKGVEDESPFGTELDLDAVDREYLVHSMAPVDPPAADAPQPRVTVGGPDCTRPYEMALLNVSAMSFGALSQNAILALNEGARIGGFAHDTGEGGMSKYHREPGGDLVWEIGTGYFGARTKDGDFDPERFRDQAALRQVKMVSLKVSQGAKPGIGGVLPGAKVTAEIAAAREVPIGQTCVSPPGHRVYSTPRELVEFVARMRELADGKPAGFKFCVGSRVQFLAVCKAMVETGVTPDFIIVDGAEGGTGAAPLEFEDHVGLPLTEGLLFVHNALVGCGLRDRIRIGASGKVATGADIVKRIIQGADFTNSARAMMFAAGCIQAERCHTNTCPSGVATQDPKRYRSLVVSDKAPRVARYQAATVHSAQRMMAAMGVRDPADLRHAQLRRRVGSAWSANYAELYDWLDEGELLREPPEAWRPWWTAAHPDRFEIDHVALSEKDLRRRGPMSA
ncbi:FMN-binding glutamate synthase family protein [Patulibacter defluvii]|uniref:FMN-binding glutamate synthase family protein n=1 Tax=Patulibacter defluvii TaxID=3095358 RepID=UPI002A74C521|nr:FMN-binding glutamate synthase family protein [Patulibacter sp. DM4]